MTIDLKALRGEWEADAECSGWAGVGIDTLRAILDRLEAAEKERDALRKDKERLDFLDRLNASLNQHYGTTYRWRLVLSPNIVRLMSGAQRNGYVGDIDLNDSDANGLESCRHAIDAAMAQEGGAETASKPLQHGVDAGGECGAEVSSGDGGWNASGTRPEEPGEYEMESHWPHRKIFRVRWDGARWMNISICLPFYRGELCRWRELGGPGAESPG